jgi:hypothetical protein
MRTLRKGYHYILVLWDINPPSEHPTRDSFKLVGAGLLIAGVLVTAAFWAADHDIDLDRYRTYFPVAFVALILLVAGGYRPVYRLLAVWFHRESKEEEPPT